MKSVYQKIEKVRKPRVHITYDVETDGATLKKELPFVVGVTGDFAGNASTAKKALKDRKFIQIDADNFNEVMNKIDPRLNLKVANQLAKDDSEIAVELKFGTMEDFEPQNIVKQVEPLRKLMEIRTELSEILSKADRSENLEAILENILQNHEQLQNISKDLGIEQTEGKGE